MTTRSARTWSLTAGLLALSAFFLTACGGSSSGSFGLPPAEPTPDPVIAAGASLPGVNVSIDAIKGGTGPGGNFQPGDTITVEFSLKYDNDDPLELVDVDRGVIMVSGPTFNYQRVIASQSDVLDRSVRIGIGKYSYSFAIPIPTTYLAPYNDTTSFTDGELTGQALLSGTYTVGMEVRKEYEVDGATLRDPGNSVGHFLLGSATTIDIREVVRDENCFQCHNELRAHGGNRTTVQGCVLCHTAGSEDKNVASAAGGTPGASIDFKVMIHKIHAGHTLPSVLGVTTNADGTRKYDATPQPYQLVGYGNSVHDFSKVVFPQWPTTAQPMPRDVGYGLLSGTEQGLENTMRSGVVSCATCHEDPDGAGPAPAPADGALAYTQPTRAACASCHDDWDPDLPYKANGTTMPIQRDDASCHNCHRESGTPLDVRDAHKHPLTDTSVAPGMNFNVTSVDEVNGDDDDTFDPGEKIGITFRVVDDANTVIAPADIGRIEIVLSGPAENPNLVHYIRFPTAALGAGPDHTHNLPENVVLESVGTSNGASLDNFATGRTPHWNVSGAETYVFLRTATGASTTLASAAQQHDNYIDVQTGAGSSFSAGDYIVIADGSGGTREFHRVRYVDTDRLWFSSQYSSSYSSRPIATTGLRNAHAGGTTVHIVTLSEVSSSNYTLTTATGSIVETVEFGAGEVLVSYTTDFIVPAKYPGTLNESPDLGQAAGDWKGLALLSGTYKLGIYGDRSVTFVNTNATNHSTDDTSYTQASHATVEQLLFGDATTITSVERISGAETCNSCHTDIQFHGNHRRGYEACILCHGNAGSEDAATYVYSSAAKNSVTIDFRTMIHKIHHGANLANKSTYSVLGYGGGDHKYDEVHFPVQHGGTMACAKCHGANNTAWKVPAERNHSSQTTLTGSWGMACGSCHDATASQAHISVFTASGGAESCAVCHGAGEDLPVDHVHVIR